MFFNILTNSLSKLIPNESNEPKIITVIITPKIQHIVVQFTYLVIVIILNIFFILNS